MEVPLKRGGDAVLSHAGGRRDRRCAGAGVGGGGAAEAGRRDGKVMKTDRAEE